MEGWLLAVIICKKQPSDGHRETGSPLPGTSATYHSAGLPVGRSRLTGVDSKGLLVLAPKVRLLGIEFVSPSLLPAGHGPGSWSALGARFLDL